MIKSISLIIIILLLQSCAAKKTIINGYDLGYADGIESCKQNCDDLSDYIIGWMNGHEFQRVIKILKSQGAMDHQSFIELSNLFYNSRNRIMYFNILEDHSEKFVIQ